MHFWQQFLTLIGGFAIFATAISWLVRVLISHFLSKDLENYKSKLSLQTTQEIERFKANLTILTAEHELRFGKLQEKRVEFLADLRT
ncbi:MAG TPA: hypothetical protein VI685_21585, partial [Candidatus Angelobacter sp.]